MRVKGVKRKKHILIMMLAALMLLLPTGILAGQTSDIEEHWAGGTISQWLEQGLAAGYPDGTFKPDHFITRAEFMALTNRALDLTEKESIDYSDVPEDAWYAEAVKIAAAAGYISGYPDGSMKPDEQISRQETAVIIATIMELPAAAEKADRFTDAEDIPAWSKGQIGAAAQEEYMTGYPDGSFRPLNPITRAEAIVALHGLFAVEEEVEVGVDEDELTEEEAIEEEEEKPVYYGGGGSSSKPRPPSAFSGGRGTENDPWQIATAQDLNKVRDYTSEEHSGKYFIQTADIDLAQSEWSDNWTPIGDEPSGDQFVGSYDGGGFVIENLKISEPGNYAGLFGFIRNASLANIHLRDVVISGSDLYTVGTLVGWSYVGSTIDNCSATGSITGTGSSGYAVGGLVGTNMHVITNCSADVEVTVPTSGSANKTGGLVGDNGWIILDSYAQGHVTGNEYVGGLAGSHSNDKISGSYSTGHVTGNKYVGGLVGVVQGTIQKSYVTGVVVGKDHVGGIAGTNSGSIKEAYSASIVTGTSNVGGLIGSLVDGGVCEDAYHDETGQSISIGNTDYDGALPTAEMLLETTYDGWDFDEAWAIEPESSYPYFQWQNNENIPYPPEPEGEFAGGSGTQIDPYQVETAVHLNNVRKYPTAYFIQTEDIDLGVAPWNENEGWVPIGSAGEKFNGVYDGGEKIISNLFIDRDGQTYTGLFGCINSSAEILNITLQEADVTGGARTGLLVGDSVVGTIRNCYVNGECSGTEQVGGLIGANLAGSIQNCHASGTVTAASKEIGGLVGSSTMNAEIINSSAAVSVNASADSNNVGGLVGIKAGLISDSFATGDVIGRGTVGGLAGQLAGGEIKNSFAIGDVTGSQAYAGGLVGLNVGTVNHCYAAGSVDNGSYLSGGVAGANNSGGEAGGTVTNCYYDQETTGQTDNDKGLPKTTLEMKTKDNYIDWDFDEIWDIVENSGYPFLRWQL